MNACEACDHARSGSASPFLVHAMRRVNSQLKERLGIDQQLNALTSSQSFLRVLAFDGLSAASLADFFLFIADLRHQVRHKSHIGLEARRGQYAIYGGP